MSQRFQRAARCAMSAFQNAAKYAAQDSIPAARAVGSKAKAASNSLAQSQAFRSFKNEALPFASFASSIPKGFAASAATPAISDPLLSKSSGSGQVRGMSSSDVKEDGDEAEGSTSKSPAAAEPPDRGKREPEPPDSLYGLGGADRDTERIAGVNMERYKMQDDADPFDLLVTAKESFMRKDERTIPIPAAVREVMYQHRWDKLLVDCRRTVNITKRGKQEAYTAMVAVGNLKGLFGLGTATAETAQLSVAQAYLDSFSNLTQIPLYRSHTIYHHIDHKFHHLQIRLMPRPDGWGLKCNTLLYELCNIAGIRNISVKVHGRRKNKFFVAQAFLEALQKQSTPYDGVEGTGTYMREIFSKSTLPAGLVRGVHVA